LPDLGHGRLKQIGVLFEQRQADLLRKLLDHFDAALLGLVGLIDQVERQQNVGNRQDEPPGEKHRHKRIGHKRRLDLLQMIHTGTRFHTPTPKNGRSEA